MRLQKLHRSSREGRRRSSINRLQSPSTPYHRMFAILAAQKTRACHAPSRSPRPHQRRETEKARHVHQFAAKRTATHFLLAESCKAWTRPAAAGASFSRTPAATHPKVLLVSSLRCLEGQPAPRSTTLTLNPTAPFSYSDLLSHVHVGPCRTKALSHQSVKRTQIPGVQALVTPAWLRPSLQGDKATAPGALTEVNVPERSSSNLVPKGVLLRITYKQN